MMRSAMFVDKHADDGGDCFALKLRKMAMGENSELFGLCFLALAHDVQTGLGHVTVGNGMSKILGSWWISGWGGGGRLGSLC